MPKIKHSSHHTPKIQTSSLKHIEFSQPTPMDISPSNTQNSPKETEAQNSPNPKPEITKTLTDSSMAAEELDDSKKRKAEEPVQDWVELGEPILRKKPLAVQRLETKCERMVQGLCINLDWCKSCKFTELLEIFEAQGWVKLMSECFDNPLAYKLVNDFKDNFVHKDGVCKSKVAGVAIEFDASVLGEAFEVPVEGFDSYFKGPTDMDVNGVKIDEIVTSIGGDPKHTITNHSSFSPLQKLLFNFVWHDLVPRPQHRHEANHLDACLIYCLENKIQINFPSLMIQHLNYCISRKYTLGYGNLLMYLFESLGINPAKHESLKLQTNHYIQPRTMAGLSLGVQDGKTVVMEKLMRRKAEKVEEEVEEKEVKEVKTKDESVEKKTKSKKGTGQSSGGTKRKSLRLAFKPAVKKDESPTYLTVDDDNNEEEEEVKEKQSTTAQVLFGPEKLSGKGFAGLSSSAHVIEELKGVKGSLKKMEEKQDTIVLRLEAIEEALGKLVLASGSLAGDLKAGVDSLTAGQKALHDRLEQMVLENKTDDEEENEPEDDA